MVREFGSSAHALLFPSSLVPSQRGHAGYEVTLNPESCECASFTYQRTDGTPRCKHVIALRIYKARTFTCDGCGVRKVWTSGL